MHVLKPNQFSGDTLTYHVELEDKISPYIAHSDALNQAYFQAVTRKARWLFNALFPKEEAFMLVYHVYGKRLRNTGMFRFIRDRTLRYQTKVTCSKVDEEILWTYTVSSVEREQLYVYRLLEAICNQDFPSLTPRLRDRGTTYPAIQFIHQDKGYTLFIYDDRGAYIRATTHEHLQALKQKVPPSDMS